jgi:hypothetical protein
MSEQGWVSIHRMIVENWVWKDKPFSKGQAWIDLIISVNHKPGKTLINGKLIDVQRGEHVTSELKLAARWGWSRKAVRNFLSLLQSDGMIIKETVPKRFILIKIVNYKTYQKGTTEDTTMDTTECIENTGFDDDEGTTEGQQKNNKRTTEEQQRDINNNDNNDNNEKNNILSSKMTPYSQIQELFNSICTTLPKVKSISGNRQTVVNTRWKEHSDLKFFEQLFVKVNQSDFLSGRNDKWKACCFDWIMKPANLTKILEGNYDNRDKNEDWRL